jgi:phosphatidylglycerophosphate synthase
MAELAPRNRWWKRCLTWSNALTMLRLLATPFFFCALLGGASGAACALFWFAVLTDIADGRVARARGEATAFGGLLDHATDASFVVLGLSALAVLGVVPVGLPFVVLVAFVQYVLDSKSLKGKILRASSLGRWNGIFYFVPLGIVVTRDALGLGFPSDSLIRLLAAALILSTLISIGDRAWTLLSIRRNRGPGE